MIHFKTNLQVIIYIIYINEPDNNFINYLKPSNGISNNYLIVSTPICIRNQYTGLSMETILNNSINTYKQQQQKIKKEDKLFITYILHQIHRRTN